MIKKRDIALSIILTIVTCGIFGIYWFIVAVDDVNKLSNKEGQFSGVIVFLLSIVTCGIFGFYYFYKMGDTIDQYMITTRGMAPASKGILYLILAFIGLSIISIALIQSDLNSIADDFNSGGGFPAQTVEYRTISSSSTVDLNK